MAPIYFGNYNQILPGISKVYDGPNLVYQKSGPTPPPHDDYFTITNIGNTSGEVKIVFRNDASMTYHDPELQYSYDGITWTDYEITHDAQRSGQGPTLYLNSNDQLQFKNKNSYFGFANEQHKEEYLYSYIFDLASSTFKASGNILSLINYGQMQDGCFSRLFSKASQLVDATELIFPNYVTNLCYDGLFFRTNITAAPALPATTLAIKCYDGMFMECYSLISPPELPATTLANSCYYYMFDGCTSLATAPELPATTLATACYYSMFFGCTSLELAPVLPATTLASNCYSSMFYGCSALEEIRLAYTGNFASGFFGYNWVYGVSPTGTFYYDGTDTKRGSAGIPEGWTVLPYTPPVPPPEIYTIYYNSCLSEASSKEVEEGYELTAADLPTLSTTDFQVDHWQYSDGTVASIGDVISADTQLYAVWVSKVVIQAAQAGAVASLASRQQYAAITARAFGNSQYGAHAMYTYPQNTVKCKASFEIDNEAPGARNISAIIVDSTGTSSGYSVYQSSNIEAQSIGQGEKYYLDLNNVASGTRDHQIWISLGYYVGDTAYSANTAAAYGKLYLTTLP